ncbi:hypothetical protein AFK24_15190 [Pseudomonas syringae]|uniref:Lipoprotein n=1 Tax=Pseudomonas syringae TaxID=317 RepID=A0A1C7Z4E7_PSESX|nr:hypothetical protein [Pseudomonas syringae]OCR24269.1 hypothetical protein AFK24_15190 [Pseudomonas syringae]
MRKVPLLAIAALISSSSAWADSCALKPPDSKLLDYQQGKGLRVIAGRYQFDLTERPDALLAFDGVMATYPKKEYISYQLIPSSSINETLSQFTTRRLSTAQLDRYLYGLDDIADLNQSDQDLIGNMRSDLKIDCQTQLTKYGIGPEVKALFQERSASDAEYRILIFSDKSTHLISVKGTRERAIEILQSIKKRSL